MESAVPCAVRPTAIEEDGAIRGEGDSPLPASREVILGRAEAFTVIVANQRARVGRSHTVVFDEDATRGEDKPSRGAGCDMGRRLSLDPAGPVGVAVQPAMRLEVDLREPPVRRASTCPRLYRVAYAVWVRVTESGGGRTGHVH